ncbi:MAG: hypothetical protein J6Y14_09515 [Fibrobacter sp.]|nr:hypothetical protein [Fibrobacter sp.]
MKQLESEKEFYAFLDAKDADGKQILDSHDISVLAFLTTLHKRKNVEAANELISYYENMKDVREYNFGGSVPCFCGLDDDHVRAINDLTEKIASCRSK